MSEQPMIIVSDDGFSDDHRPAKIANGGYRVVTLEQLREGDDGSDAETELALSNDIQAADIVPLFDAIDAISIDFPSFADGRGFSLATQLRRLGFDGTLIGQGHVIADQYAHARRCGFDTVAISKDLAERQPEDQWTVQVARINLTYQNRLHQAASVA